MCVTVLKGRWSCPFVVLLVCFVYRNGVTVKWTAKTKGKQTTVCDTSALACGNWGIHSVPMWSRDTGKLMHEYMFLKSYNTTWQCRLDLKAVCRLPHSTRELKCLLFWYCVVVHELCKTCCYGAPSKTNKGYCVCLSLCPEWNSEKCGLKKKMWSYCFLVILAHVGCHCCKQQCENK